jgi:putative ABC transport system ATP-binding protein
MHTTKPHDPFLLAPEAPSTGKLLVIKDLKKSYADPAGGRMTILDVPSFSMDRKEQVVLRGESGGGKTTLLHVISGLISADSGSIQLEGVELTGFSEARRDRIRAAKMGYVFQTFNLLPAFTALENVRLGMTFGGKKIDAERAKELLRRVGLEQRMHYLPSQLSVGQQQRVSVARALANRPILLLADEPTANVDPANQDRIIELIAETCREESVALLLVTHSDAVAGRFSRVERLENINRAAAMKGIEHTSSMGGAR